MCVSAASNASHLLLPRHKLRPASSRRRSPGHRLGVALASADQFVRAAPPTDASGGPVLSSLYRYPVKSGRAEPVGEARLTPEGLEGDRRFVVVSAADGTHRTQRELPRLAILEATVDSAADVLRLRAGAGGVNVSISREGAQAKAASLFGAPLRLADQGDIAAAWLSSWLASSRGGAGRRGRGRGGGGGGDGGGGIFAAAAAILSAAAPPRYRLLRAPDPGTGGEAGVAAAGAAASGAALRGGAGLADVSPLLLVCARGRELSISADLGKSREISAHRGLRCARSRCSLSTRAAPPRDGPTPRSRASGRLSCRRASTKRTVRRGG
jgi:hypothetical protein